MHVQFFGFAAVSSLNPEDSDNAFMEVAPVMKRLKIGVIGAGTRGETSARQFHVRTAGVKLYGVPGLLEIDSEVSGLKLKNQHSHQTSFSFAQRLAGPRDTAPGKAGRFVHAIRTDESRLDAQAVQVPQSLYQKLDNQFAKARPIAVRASCESFSRPCEYVLESEYLPK